MNFCEKLDLRLLFVTYCEFETYTKWLLERNIIKGLGKPFNFE